MRARQKHRNLGRSLLQCRIDIQGLYDWNLSDKVYILNVYGTCNKKEHKLRKQVIIKNFQLFLKKNGKELLKCNHWNLKV